LEDVFELEGIDYTASSILLILKTYIQDKSHLSWYLRLCCCDWTILTHCWPAYHAAPSHHFNVYKMQLPIWCSIVASVIMWHQRYSSCTGYLWSTELSTSCVHLCTRSTLDVHHSTWV